MSYDLRVWEPPAGQATPASFEAALRSWFELELVEPGPNPKFAALAAQMAAYKDYGDAPWVGDPVADAKACRKAVWTFQLPADNRMQLLVAVVRRANALGLTVLDDQLGLALAAPNQVLPPERTDFWKEAMQVLEGAPRGTNGAPAPTPPPPPAAAPVPAPAPMTMALVSARDEMRAVLASLLPQHGFISPRVALDLPYYRAQAEATYFRTTPAGGQGVVLLTSTTNQLPCLTIDVNVFSEEIANILRAVFPEHDEMFFRRQLNFHVGIFHGVPGYVPIRSTADLQRMVQEVQDPVGPILEMTRTPQGMHAIMAGTTLFPLPPGNRQGHKSLAEHAQQNFGYAALVSAWLYGGDQFQAMAQKKRETEERLAPAAKKDVVLARVERLLAYLRAQVKRKA